MRLLRFSCLVPLAVAACVAVAACDRQSGGDTQGTERSSAGLPKPAMADANASDLASAVDRLQAGAPLPAVTVQDASGNTLDLKELKGKPVLLNLWATWCAPCIKEMPTLDDLAAELDGQVAVVTVSQDKGSSAVVGPFWAQQDYAYLKPWVDPDARLGTALGEGNLPVTVLYGADGNELWRVVKGQDWSLPEAAVLIEESIQP